MKYLISFVLSSPIANTLENLSAPVLAIFLVLSLVLLFLLARGISTLMLRMVGILIVFLVTMTDIWPRLKKSSARFGLQLLMHAISVTIWLLTFFGRLLRGIWSTRLPYPLVRVRSRD